MYGLVMAFLPQSYTVVASSRVEEEIQRLAEALAQTEAAAASPLLDQFSRDNQALVILTGEAGSQSFGSLPSEAVDNALTTSLEITFADSDSPYALSVTAPVSPGRELTLAFLELLPLLLLLIALLASLGAFLCSRVLARPVLEISRVAQRMARLDMTWECSVTRGDELGVLAKKPEHHGTAAGSCHGGAGTGQPAAAGGHGAAHPAFPPAP